MLNRRSFLRAIAGAAVGAAVAPYIPVPVETARQIPQHAAAGRIGYKVLAQTYAQLANPTLRPNMMVCSRETYDYLCERLGVENAFKDGSV